VKHLPGRLQRSLPGSEDFDILLEEKENKWYSLKGRWK
jgi:hypothetical protein